MTSSDAAFVRAPSVPGLPGLVGLSTIVLVLALALSACGGEAPPSDAPSGPSGTSSSVVASPQLASPSPSTPVTTVPPRPAPTSATCANANDKRSWYYLPSQSHDVPGVPSDVRQLLRKYGARYVGETDDKIVYLTFDAGYENGMTKTILDTLRAKAAPAAFFLTGTYIRDNGALVRRMARDGHVVANHTFTHPSLPSLAYDEAALEKELSSTAAAFRSATGKQMARILRPPSGEYSARTLCLTHRLGYLTVFWSFAHRDWIVNDQPPVSVTLERILTGSHNGAVYLLHAVSSSDAEALPEAIDGLRGQGYRFGLLTDLM